MRHTRGRVVEVDDLTELDARWSAGAASMSGWRIYGLDLTERSEQLSGCRVEGAAFLGCTLAPGDHGRLTHRGALVLPAIPDAPVEVHRSGLYTPRELFDTPEYADSLDARAYAWARQQPDADDALAQALHDHAVDNALGRWVRDRRLVGVMGGHRLARGEPAYAAAARLGRGLGTRCTVATGGGPGAMEAANLGAALSGHEPAAVEVALERLAAQPSFRPSVQAWVQPALALLDELGPVREGLGIPTWHYGHEPPNVFATTIAKYFGNATREAVLLQVCNAGIVFLPGAAGTVQEIFQDACENYYADVTAVAPMVLVGREYWTETLPAWPLLRALARGTPMEPHVHLVEHGDEAVALLAG